MVSNNRRAVGDGKYTALPVDELQALENYTPEKERRAWLDVLLRDVPVFLAGCFLSIVAMKLTTLDLTRVKTAPGTWATVSQREWTTRLFAELQD
jgi:hypothetical protein